MLTCRIHAASSTYYSQKSMQGFILSPPPIGVYSHSPTNSGLHEQQIPYNEDIKPRFQNSISESESSEQSSKFQRFNFHHSPVAPRVSNLHFDKAEVTIVMKLWDIIQRIICTVLFCSIHVRCRCLTLTMLNFLQPCHPTVLLMSEY